MKITVEIDLPFIDEDGALHDDSKHQILESVANHINRQVEQNLKPKIDALMNDSINSAIDSILDGYLSKPVVISNGYKQDNYESVYDMVEKKFGALYDAEIKRTSATCGSDPVLIKLEQKLKQHVQQLMQQTEAKIDKESRVIAARTLKESALYSALEKLGIEVKA